MKKQLLACALVFVAASLLAQNIKKTPFLKRHQNPATNSLAAKSSFLKSGSTVKPLQGKYYFFYDQLSQNYYDSTSFTRTYFPDGSLKSEEHSSLETGEKIMKTEYTYDIKGYEDTEKHYRWDTGAFVPSYEYGKIKTYDTENLITNYKQFSTWNNDTSNLINFDFIYDGDTAYIFGVDKESSAPNNIAEKYIVYHSSGGVGYTNINMYFWDNSNQSYNTVFVSNLIWNGSMALERLFYVKEFDIWFKSCNYIQTYDGVAEEGRIRTNLTTAKYEILLELKQGLIYVPDERDIYLWDEHGNNTQSSYEYDYNVVTQTYDIYGFDKIDNTYNQEDHLIREVFSNMHSGRPEYQLDKEYWYTDFVDVAGINNVKSNIILDLYPNPANAKLVVSASEKIISLQVQSLNGAFLPTVAVINNKTAEIETTDLPNGVYLISTTSAKGVGKAKFIVSH